MPVSTKATPCRVYIADLACYNEGTLRGRWMDLDDYADAEEFAEAVDGFIRKAPGHEEYAIHDYEGFAGYEVGEWESFKTLFEIKEALEKHDEDVLRAALIIWCDLDAAIEAVEQHYIGHFESHADFARHWAEATEAPEPPSWLVIDWEESGQSLIRGGGFTEDGGHWFYNR